MFIEEMIRANPISSVEKRDRWMNSRGKRSRTILARSGRAGPMTEKTLTSPLPSTTSATRRVPRKRPTVMFDHIAVTPPASWFPAHPGKEKLYPRLLLCSSIAAFPRRFDFLQGAALGFRHGKKHECEGEQAHDAVHAEGYDRTDRSAVVEHGEGLSHYVAGGPDRE